MNIILKLPGPPNWNLQGLSVIHFLEYFKPLIRNLIHVSETGRNLFTVAIGMLKTMRYYAITGENCIFYACLYAFVCIFYVCRVSGRNRLSNEDIRIKNKEIWGCSTIHTTLAQTFISLDTIWEKQKSTTSEVMKQGV